MSRRVIVAAGLAVVLAAAVGVGLLVQRDGLRSATLDAVRRYDDALVRATSRLDPRQVAEVATPAEQQRVANYVTLLWGSGVYLESEITSLELTDVREEGQAIVATVSERWRYQRRDRATRAVTGPGERRSQIIRYTLVRQDGRWVVDRSEILRESK